MRAARTLATSPKAYDRGAALADRLVADLVTGGLTPGEFAFMVADRFGGVNSELMGIAGGLAVRLAQLVATRAAQ